MSQILGLKFRDYGQVYYFSSGPYVVKENDAVLVKTDQGLGLAQVAMIPETPPEDLGDGEIKPIYRLANDEDLDIDRQNRDLAREALRLCRGRARERDLDMKLVDVEVMHDRGKMIFYFTAPGRVDFRELVKDLVKAYHTRIELRQIGVRHETQMLGAIGNCGQTCCCRRFMRKFAPVTIKMAKEQNLFLNPVKISGICGRLLCCLGFEQENYEQFQKKCPRVGKKFSTKNGTVKVLRTNLFRETISLLDDIGEEHEVSVDTWRDIVLGPYRPENGPVEGEAVPRPEGPPEARTQGAGQDAPRRENGPDRGQPRPRPPRRERGNGPRRPAPPRSGETRSGETRSARPQNKTAPRAESEAGPGPAPASAAENTESPR